MLHENLKKITLLQSLLTAKTDILKAKLGLKLITRSDPCEVYDLFWILTQVVEGKSNPFEIKVKAYLNRLLNGEDVEFNVRQSAVVVPDEKLCLALHLAAGGHAGQKRKGMLSRPYMHHILMVWYITALSGADIDTQIAALLHDFLEDVPDRSIQTSTLNVVLASVFNSTVFKYCHTLKNKEGLSGKTPEKAKEKHAWQLEHLAKMPSHLQNLKLIDRLCNLYDCRRDGPKGNTPHSIQAEFVKWREFYAQVDHVDMLVEMLSLYVQDLLIDKYSLKF